MFKSDPLAQAANVVDHSETIFTRNTSFSGTLKSDGDIRIYGAFEGEIETAGMLIVGKAARVVASISAHDVGIAGTVVGNITAVDRLEIYAGGRVYGDVVAGALRIEDGAIFSGQSTMREADLDPYLLETTHRPEITDRSQHGTP
ncbi:MAG: polymer-forming cytoskeletal protein [Chloroflexi bacterium]|nr:polymer-forming cytoskeletal protein [Chloroflexota bacterium]